MTTNSTPQTNPEDAARDHIDSLHDRAGASTEPGATGAAAIAWAILALTGQVARLADLQALATMNGAFHAGAEAAAQTIAAIAKEWDSSEEGRASVDRFAMMAAQAIREAAASMPRTVPTAATSLPTAGHVWSTWGPGAAEPR